MRFNHDMLKHVFLFDYYNNEAKNEIKAGFRFTLQSKKRTINEKEINEVMQMIIDDCLSIESVTIPGLDK